MNYDEARNIIIENVKQVCSEKISLSESAGRILAENITARFNIPFFDRSPYDGYAFKSEDTLRPPVTLKIIDEIPAGGYSTIKLHNGEAVKILTGAMVPEGADAVVKYEDTKFNSSEVTIFKTFKSGDNIVKAGEDIKSGEIIAYSGEIIDAGTAGVLASQNISTPLVYRKPVIGIISTGSELQDLNSELLEGKIYNSSRYSFETALKTAGFITEFFGIVRDDEDEIAKSIKNALSKSDALILTGGVSAGDYDKTPEALKILNAKIIVRDVKLKPGGKCVYAVKDEKLICCLSGNPASALTNYYAVALPALKKLSGRKNFIPHEIYLELENSFNKKSPITRIIRGKLNFHDGKTFINIPSEQGNGVLSSMSGSNVMAVIPEGSGKLSAGEILKGFIL